MLEGVWERRIVFGAVQSAAHMKDPLCSKFLMNRCTDWSFERNSIGARVWVCVCVCSRSGLFSEQLSDKENSLQEH